MQPIAELEEQFNRDDIAKVPQVTKDNLLMAVSSFLGKMKLGKGTVYFERKVVASDEIDGIVTPIITGERLVIMLYREV